MRMPRVVMAGEIAAPCPAVHGIPLDGGADRAIMEGMSRETVNLLCAELPGAEKVADGAWDLWTAAGHGFARVGERVEVRTDLGWAPVPADVSDHDLRERIVEAYERLRHSLPPEDQPRLDRTSG